MKAEHKIICFDIETGPETSDWLGRIQPEFEPAKNLKDPEKIAADIESKRSAWIDRAALDPMTGQVLAVGVQNAEYGFAAIAEPSEAETVSKFWSYVMAAGASGRYMVGWNIFGFDIPFMSMRALRHGVYVPAYEWHRLTPYCHRWEHFIDLARVFGQKHGGGIYSLDSASKFLIVGSKNGNGKDFARLWSDDQDAALDYLKNDVELVAKIAGRLAQRIDGMLGFTD